ncbi:uncharacterized protein LOC106671167 isoform X1 [Cimex lectularius]|uniref:Uncharacterized protein n=2 Tax=Cimex lectularius TaxID=79782 RepID=A0A8I6S5H3_CIMLE|nr:uncharacterized protein LOC106671167 isoform X1 [Cimex lectularius]
MAYFASIQPAFLCCDVISRLREDINCLCSDTKMLVQMQNTYDILIPQLENLLDEFSDRLKLIPHTKANHSDDNSSQHKISEFVDFMRLSWKCTSQILDRNCKMVRFLSSRGIPITSYLEKLMILTDFIQKYYHADFVHSECALLFSHLCKQLRVLLAPELVRGDELEAALAFVHSAIPSIINLFTLIDLFNYTPRFLDVATFCKEIIDGEVDPPPSEHSVESSEIITSRFISDLLTGKLLGQEPISDTKPVVEGRIKRFYELATELAQYVIKISCPVKPPYSHTHVTSLAKAGCLDPLFYESLPPLSRKPSSQLRTTPSRGRGRPRRLSRIMTTVPYGFDVASPDLGPIRMPSLQLPFVPFDY